MGGSSPPAPPWLRYPPVAGERQTIDSLLVDWKMIVLSFFLHGSFVLKYYENSFNQRDFFFHGSLVYKFVQ